MSNHLLWIAQPAFLIFTVAFAFYRGEASDKAGAGLILLVYVLADILLAVTFPRFPTLLMMMLDFSLAVGLLALALKYSSIWLGIAMLLQSIALASHAFRLEGFGLGAIQEVILNNGLSNLMLVCIIAATTASWRVRRKRTPGRLAAAGERLSAV